MYSLILIYNVHIFIPIQNECFRGYTGISLSVCPCFRSCVRLCAKYYFLSKRWRGYQGTFSDSSSSFYIVTKFLFILQWKCILANEKAQYMYSVVKELNDFVFKTVIWPITQLNHYVERTVEVRKKKNDP